MSEGKTRSTSTTRISSFVIMVILVTLALSFIALILAIINISTPGQEVTASYLFIIGSVGLALSTFWLFQTRRRLASLRIEVPAIMTTIECRKCGNKNVREFQRGDYIFKEGDPCQKCNDKMLITAIYRELKDRELKEKEKAKAAFPP